MKTKVLNMYLDWFNNFLTLDRFAEHYDISQDKAIRIIDLGRLIQYNISYSRKKPYKRVI